MDPRPDVQALFARVCAGDEEAGLEFFVRYRRVVKGIARRWLDAHPELRRLFDSDDFSQETWRKFFLDIKDSRASVMDEEHARRLMALLTRNTAREEIERQHRDRRDIDRTSPLTAAIAAPMGESAPEEYVEQCEIAAAVLRVLEPQDRRIVESRHSGLKWDEVAEQENLTPEAARSRFRRALKKMIEHVREGGEPKKTDSGGE